MILGLRRYLRSPFFMHSIVYLAGLIDFMRPFIFFLLTMMTIASCNRKVSAEIQQKPGGLEIVHPFGFVKATDLSEVLFYAKAENKLVFLDVYTDWCLPCQVMDEDVFSDIELAHYFDERFVSYKVNAEKGTGPLIAINYEVPAYPTLLFLNADGEVLVKKLGSARRLEMYDLADEALAKGVMSEEGNN